MNAFGRERAASDHEYIDTVRRSGEALLSHMRSEGRETHLIRYEELAERCDAILSPVVAKFGYETFQSGTAPPR